MKEKQYIAIDLKSFYASVECHERGLDPMTTKLVVADPTRTEKTICLAISPAMKKLGIKTFMLTGDNAKTAEKVAEQTKVWGYKAKLMPDNKVEEIEKLLINNSVAFVGDGINDAPSLARADVGIAMGGIGSDAAIEAADAVFMTTAMASVPEAIGIARSTRRIAIQNVVFAHLLNRCLVHQLCGDS